MPVWTCFDAGNFGGLHNREAGLVHPRRLGNVRHCCAQVESQSGLFQGGLTRGFLSLVIGAFERIEHAPSQCAVTVLQFNLAVVTLEHGVSAHTTSFHCVTVSLFCLV